MATRNSIGSNKPIEVPFGGTGIASATAYAVICGGTTSTNPFQNVSGLGTAGQVLTSNGAGTLPTWQAGGGVPSYTGITAFVPILNFTTGSTGITYNAGSSKFWYMNIGALINVSISLYLTSIGSSTGEFYIGGMPAQSGLVPDDYQILNCNASNLASSPADTIQATITTNPIGGATAIKISYPQLSTGGTVSYLSNSLMTNTTRIFITGSYI